MCFALADCRVGQIDSSLCDIFLADCHVMCPGCGFIVSECRAIFYRALMPVISCLPFRAGGTDTFVPPEILSGDIIETTLLDAHSAQLTPCAFCISRFVFCTTGVGVLTPHPLLLGHKAWNRAASCITPQFTSINFLDGCSLVNYPNTTNMN